jgi:anti-anti-sigma factor
MPVRTSKPFTCELIPERDRVRVAPTGDLDLATVPELESTVRELLEAGFGHIVLDLSHVEFLDSTGLHAIVRLWTDANTRRSQLTLKPGPPAVQRIFELTHTTEMLTFESPARRVWTRRG